MEEISCILYLFRSRGFAPSGDTVVAVEPHDRVISVYGDGGIAGEGGLSAAFGGAVVFRNEQSGQCFLGVWGARNASRFRTGLRTRMQISVIKEPPPARIVFRGADKVRPRRPGTVPGG